MFESVHFFSGIASCHGLSLSMSRVLTMCYIIFRCFRCLTFFSLCNSSCTNMLEMWRCVKSNDSNKKTANKTVEIHFHAYILFGVWLAYVAKSHFWIGSIWNRVWFASMLLLFIFLSSFCKVSCSWIKHIWLVLIRHNRIVWYMFVPVFEIGNNNNDNSRVTAIID